MFGGAKIPGKPAKNFLLTFSFTSFSLSEPLPSRDTWNDVVSRLYDSSNGRSVGFGPIRDDLGDSLGELSDVTFVLTEDDGLTERRFHAHRLLLSLRSPVFRAMFNGPLREQQQTITVEDVSPRYFF